MKLKDQKLLIFRHVQRTIALAVIATFLSTQLSATCATGAAVTLPYPRGAYGMLGLTDQISSSTSTCSYTTTSEQLLQQNMGLVGILLDVPWSSLETTSTSIDWTSGAGLEFVDRVQEAQVCGFAVAIEMPTMLNNLPQWVYTNVNNGGIYSQIVTLGSYTCSTPCTGTAPVFWDATFNTERISFYQAVATEISTLPAAVRNNIVAVLIDPFGVESDDWEVNLLASELTGPSATVSPSTPAYSNSLMLSAAQTLISGAASAFPHLNIKVPIQVSPVVTPDSNMMLATDVLNWAYRYFPVGSFYGQVNHLHGNSPDGCSGALPCAISGDATLNLLAQYGPIGLQDAGAVINGASDSPSCRQNGTSPCQPSPCDPSSNYGTPTYAMVLGNSVATMDTYSPAFWEVWKGDAITQTNPGTTCTISSSDQTDMDTVFTNATISLGGNSRR